MDDRINTSEFNEVHINIDDVHFTILTDYGTSFSEPKNQKIPTLSHFHSYYEIFYVKNGQLDINFENTKKHLGKNALIIVPPKKIITLY